MRGWLNRRRERRYDRACAAVLGRLLLGDVYALDIWKRIGGSSGDIYVALARLERQGLAWSELVEQPGGAPRRRRYGVTRKALEDRAWEAR
jgi:DNA-binding PadR family transcriptional regulator